MANREIELALRDARVRGRESEMAVQLELLGERAQWVEERRSLSKRPPALNVNVSSVEGLADKISNKR